MPSYSSRYGGAAVNVTIDRFAYAMVSETDENYAEIASSDYGGLMDDSQAPRPESFDRPARSILNDFGVERGVSVFLTSELPPNTGIGTMSGTAVALTWALAHREGRPMTATEAGRRLSMLEKDKLGLLFGISDPYAQAYGGLTFVSVSEEIARVDTIPVPEDFYQALQSRLMLFYTGRTQHNTGLIIDANRAAERNRAGVIEALHELRTAATDLRDRLVNGELEAIGPSLDRTWKATRRLGPGMSDAWVDQWYAMALNAGATGGKLNGLGDSGFLLLYCEPDRQDRVTESLQSAGLRRIGVRFEPTGASLLLDDSTVGARSLQRSSAGNSRT